MSETLVLELNQNNADHPPKVNGDYIVTLADTVIMNEGDSINLRMASIDSQKADANTIVIENDTNLGITFSIYDVDYDNTDKRVQDNTAPWSDSTFNYYAA